MSIALIYSSTQMMLTAFECKSCAGGGPIGDDDECLMCGEKMHNTKAVIDLVAVVYGECNKADNSRNLKCINKIISLLNYFFPSS